MYNSLDYNNQNIEVIPQSKDKIIAINFENINDYYRKGYFVFYNDSNELSCVLVKPSTISYIKRKYNNIIKFYSVTEKDLFSILEQSFSQLITHKSQHYLSLVSKDVSAKTVDYKKMITGFLLLFTISLIFFSNLFHFANNAIYLAQNFFKMLLFKRSIAKNLNPPLPTFKKHEGKIPIYTIFVPLYKEVRKLRSIIRAIDNLDYPKSKLDVKFIIEADDKETIKALSIIDLPRYIHVIKVPFSLPRTKPKAMNYATAYIKGDYLCIYDAEDKPDSDQLLKALHAFKQLPEEYACVQARLNFYNSGENLLTRFFSMEYTLWFEYLLKGLDLYGLPITLGGTSNHFKVSVLKKIGYWDAYNVTEDADLGIRLYSKGYKVHIIDSKTLEEAPISLGNWLTQRTRWIKGFIQTIYIFLLSPKNYQVLGFRKVLSIYVFIGFSSYSFFCMPWIMVAFLFTLDQYLYYLWFINTGLSLAFVYSSIYYITRQKKFTLIDFCILPLWPFYFVLHSIAAYLSVVEIFLMPFKWNKTTHGVSATELE
jgi:cellulose synthase/poly-beta-1,6-N-acetylglucosamine synthase-like glycosyltransferase